MRKLKGSQGPIRASIALPGSKSISHRVLVCSALSQGRSRLWNLLESEDTMYTRMALEKWGIKMAERQGGLEVEGSGGKIGPWRGEKRIYLGNSGTSMRLLLSISTLAKGTTLLDGTQRMRSRPVGELAQALTELGAELSFPYSHGYPPILVKGSGLIGGGAKLSGSGSSQFISSLLLSAPYCRKDVEINVDLHPVSAPYVDLTIGIMACFGVRVERIDFTHFFVAAHQSYQSIEFHVEGDVSSASYFWAAAAVTGGEVTTGPLDPSGTMQGDIRFLEILEEAGCKVERGSGEVCVKGKAWKSLELDMADIPDMVPTMAAIALFLEGTTVIRNVAHLRIKESDRLRAIFTEWRKLGARVEELPDGLVIHGGKRLCGALLDPHNDHRLAMSMAVIGLNVPGITVTNSQCVEKSFPGFWPLWDQITS